MEKRSKNPAAGARAAARVALLAAAVGAASCEADAPPLPAPTAPRLDALYVTERLASGDADLVATLDLTFVSDQHDRPFALGDVEITSGEGVAPWVIDSVEPQGEWPLEVPAGGVLARRTVVVHAHAPLIADLAPGTLAHVQVRSGEHTLDAVLRSESHTANTEVCPPPDLTALPPALGASLGWTAATLPGLVHQPRALTVDDAGRAWLLTSYVTPLGQQGARVFGAKDGLIGPVLELVGQHVNVAAGGAPDTLMVAENRRDLVVKRVDLGLVDLWSRAVNLAFTTTQEPPIAVSGGRVLVGFETQGPLTIDGAPVDSASADVSQIALFDEATGALVATKGGLRVTAAAPYPAATSDGAFLVAAWDPTLSERLDRLMALEADLGVRWSIPLRATVIAGAPDGTAWALGDDALVHVDADGAVLETVAAPGAGSIAPLPGGDALVGGHQGIARLTPGGSLVWRTLPPQPTGFCSASARLFAATAPGGAVLGGRPFTGQDGAGDGRAIFAHLLVP